MRAIELRTGVYQVFFCRISVFMGPPMPPKHRVHVLGMDHVTTVQIIERLREMEGRGGGIVAVSAAERRGRIQNKTAAKKQLTTFSYISPL
jgi:hypothetical protein